MKRINTPLPLPLFVEDIETIARLSIVKKMRVSDVTEMYTLAVYKFGRKSQLEKITSLSVDLVYNGLTIDEAVSTAGVILNDDYRNVLNGLMKNIERR